MSKEIDINNEEEILKECDFYYYYECYECSRELCMFFNDLCNKTFMNTQFDNKQARIDLGRIAITLNKQFQQIADLEAKLAEQQECSLKASAKHNLEMQNTEICIKELEAKLAESENKVKGFVELFDKKQHENYEQFCEIQQLKQQLAEKDKELHYKTAECEKWKADYENCSKLEKLMSKERQYCLDNWRASEQDKISFCIEKLEKVRDLYKKHLDYERIYDEFRVTILEEEIDDQIKTIKGD